MPMWIRLQDPVYHGLIFLRVQPLSRVDDAIARHGAFRPDTMMPLCTSVYSPRLGVRLPGKVVAPPDT